MSSPWASRVVGTLLLLGVMAMTATANSVYVSPAGRDCWSGRLAEPNATATDGPKASPSAGLEALRASGQPHTARLVLRGGEYWLEQPLLLGPEDSGLTLEAAPGEHPVLFGGRRIIGWQREREGLWSADLPEVAAGRWDFRALVVNGRMCARARFPAEGYLTHLSEFPVRWMSTTGGGWERKPTEEELTTMVFRAGDLPPSLEARNAEITVYHMWDESLVGVAALDRERNVLRFSNPAGHPPGAFGVKNYVVWNTREGLTRPGQWYLDRVAGRVVYWPLPGEDMARARVAAPTTETIVRVAGSEDRPVRGVTIRGLCLSVTGTPLVSGGFGASAFAGALSLSHATYCRILEAEILNVAGQGIKAEACTRLRLERCHVHHTGACGVICRGERNVVADNRLHDVGVTYPSAIALFFGGRESRIEHNEIHDAPYTGIAGEGADHHIEANHLFRVMQELHDGAAIYITFCQRVAVRGNYVHDIVDTGGYGASAYYLDEQAEDCVVEGNVSENVVRPSHNHMARNNTLRENVFVTAGDMSLTFMRSSDYCLAGNVLWAGGRIKLDGAEAIASAEGNVYSSQAGDMSPTMAGFVRLDPSSAGTAHGDLRLHEGSPLREGSPATQTARQAGPRGR